MRDPHRFLISFLILFTPIYSFAQWTSKLLPGADSARGVNAVVTDGTDIYAFLLDGPDTMSAAFRYHDGIWSQTSHDTLNGKSNIWSAIAVKPNLILAGSWSYGIYFSSDQGGTWSNTLSEGTPADTLIDGFAYDGTNIYACGYDAVNSKGLISTSTDGVTWNAMALPGSGNFRVRTLCWTGSRLFAGTDSGAYYYEAGAWHDDDNFPLSDSASLYSMAYDSSSHIFYAGVFGSTLFSSDNANTADSTTVSWTEQSIPTGFNLLSLAVTSNSTLVAGVPGDYVYYSQDHGATWTHSVNGLENTAANTVLEFKGTTYVGLDSGYVATLGDNSLPVQVAGYKATSSNGAVLLTWQTRSEVNNAGFNILRKDPGAENFAVIASYTSDDSLKGLGTSTTGRSYSYTDTKVQSGLQYTYSIESVLTSGATANFGSLPVSVAAPKNYALSQNYPNPFNPSTIINYQLPINSQVTLKVYDVLGREVAMLVDGQQDAGVYKVPFDGTRFSSGVYFYRIAVHGSDGRSFVSTKKLVLMK